MEKKRFKLYEGDNIMSLKKLPDNSIDSVVSDPPYGLSFMNKKWDYDVPSVQFWKEVYRVLKPGGHVLSFGGTRTYHRMVVNMEDAGFEIRDQIMWIYSTGFPKSLNILKQINKTYICEYRKIARTAVKSLKLAQVKLNEDTEDSAAVYVAILQEEGQKNKMEIGVVVDLSQTDIFIFATREVIEENTTLLLKNILVEDLYQERKFITSTELKTIIDLKIWNLLQSLNTQNFIHIQEAVMNMGTSIKPANEPICLARKSLSEKSVAENVLKWKTGGINVDGCRIGQETIQTIHNPKITGKIGQSHGEQTGYIQGLNSEHEGRFPANIIFDESAAEVLDEQSGVSKSNCKSGIVEGKEANVFNDGEKKASGHKKKIMVGDYNDKGGASRFFYIAKVSKKERNMGLDHFEEITTDKIGSTYAGNQTTSKIGADPDKATQPKKNNHPTVKPINLMTYLCRLITPENGIVLDPFMGSGSTGIAALIEGFRFCGMEMDKDYMKIAEARIEAYEQYRDLLK